MEPSARASLRPHALRPLGQPRAIAVEVDRLGLPARVDLRRDRGRPHPLAVEEVQDVWRVAEAWWREAPVHRTYYRVAVDQGRSLTLFHDDIGGDAHLGWYEQHY